MHLPNIKHPKIRKQLCFFIPVFIFSCVMVCLLFYPNDQRSFTQLSKELFTGEMISNTLNMHYTIAHPENYNIEYIPCLSVYSPDRSANSSAEVEKLISQLEHISPGKLSPSDAYTYDLLLSYLYNQRTESILYLYGEPFAPSSGVQAALPILLTDYAFRSVKDVEDYLAILNQVDDMLAGMILFEQEKAKSGLFMSDQAVEKVIDQCDNIISKEKLLTGTHFLQSTFQERVDALEQEKILTPADKEIYLAENNRLLSHVVQPAYEKTGDELYLLKGSGKNEMGLSYYPEGQKYYQYLLKSSTGSYRSINGIKKLLYDDFTKHYEELRSLSKAHPELSSLLQTSSPELPLKEPAEILENLQQNIVENYPALPSEKGSAKPVCIIKNVSDSMEPYSSPAYYLTPPIDSYLENTIYINQKNNVNSLTLYTTLAHEGYPGHLYQSVYHRFHMAGENGNPLRHILHYGGYLEGWALYVEMDSFQYAKQMAAANTPEMACLYDYYRLNRSLQLCLYSLLDISIHYDGADLPQVQKILAVIGIQDKNTVQSIYEYIVEEPANYLKYYLGYLEIHELKKQAQELWGEKYRDYDFHQFFLDAGPSDFSNLEKLLKNWKKDE